MPERTDLWFNSVAEYLGTAYLRNAFTKGTEQEVEFLVGELGLETGMRVLDVGCGPGRHSLALARRGIVCHGIDASPTFIELARDAAAAASLDATFELADVRDLAYDGQFDVLICLCQGGFGLLRGEEDGDLIARFARAVVPGGRVAISAFHAPFAIRHLEAGENFDVVTGVFHETATLRDDSGREEGHDLWTTCFTARELRLLAHAGGLRADLIAGVTPGAYSTRPPTLDDPELLLLATRAATG
ncbi:MAG TPA: class I SAM-dependent methyltransferase [Acidimicrobiia bacterium]